MKISKRGKKLLLALLFLIFVAFFIQYFGWFNINKDFKDFSITNTDKIGKIFIADAAGNTVTLKKKKDDSWELGAGYEVRPNSIKTILNTFKYLEIKSPVSKAAFENVVKRIATTSTKVEVYLGENNKPFKTYYVGSNTADQQGTFMLLEKNGVMAEKPYIVYIPGFYGYLTSRFFTNSKLWINPVTFDYKSDQIKEVSITYFDENDKSFTLLKEEGNVYLKGQIKDSLNLIKNQEKAKQYLDRFEKIFFEGFVDDNTEQMADSLNKIKPYFKIEVLDTNKTLKEITAYRVPKFDESDSFLENPSQYDLTRMYGILDTSVVYIQYLTFDRLTVERGFFE